MSLEKEVSSTDSKRAESIWCIVSGDSILVRQMDDNTVLPMGSEEELGLEATRKIYLGSLDGRTCYAIEVSPANPRPPGIVAKTLRELFRDLDDRSIGVVSQGVQILHWDETNRFCSRCGSQTEDSEGERAKVCPACGFTSYPCISPAVIVAVRKGRELLLVRAHRHRAGLYSNVAGFVEAGESLEQCVRREIREEVGLEVKNLRYFGSQCWPFPHSLMVGFTAEYSSGEIRRDEGELADAQWFPFERLPRIPEGYTIARQLINSVIGEVRDE